MKGHRPRHSRSAREESAIKWTFGLFSIFALVWVLIMFGSGLMNYSMGPADFTEVSTVAPTFSSFEQQVLPNNSYLWTE